MVGYGVGKINGKRDVAVSGSIKGSVFRKRDDVRYTQALYKISTNEYSPSLASPSLLPTLARSS